jgi:hypothetical protein
MIRAMIPLILRNLTGIAGKKYLQQGERSPVIAVKRKQTDLILLRKTHSCNSDNIFLQIIRSFCRQIDKLICIHYPFARTNVICHRHPFCAAVTGINSSKRNCGIRDCLADT